MASVTCWAFWPQIRVGKSWPTRTRSWAVHGLWMKKPRKELHMRSALEHRIFFFFLPTVKKRITVFTEWPVFSAGGWKEVVAQSSQESWDTALYLFSRAMLPCYNMVGEWSSSKFLPQRRKEDETKITKRMRLFVSNRQKWGQMGPYRSMLSYRLNAFSCMWTSTRILTSLTDGQCVTALQCALCCVCVHSIELEIIYRGLGDCGLGESRERETERTWRAGKTRCWKLEEKKRWGGSLWLQLHFSDHMGHLELGITFSVLNHKCLHFCKV